MPAKKKKVQKADKAAEPNAAEPPPEKLAAKRAKADKQAEAPESDLTKADRTRMLGWLKYQQQAAKTTAEQKEYAKSGLACYENLDKNRKSAFVTRWKATKDKKNADWVKDFEKEMNRTREFTREKKTGLMTMRVQFMII